MIEETRSLVNKQVRRVQRRLFAKVIAESLVLGLASALLLIMGWFLVRPFAFPGPEQTLRWTVPAAILGIGALGGLIMAWLRRPNLVASSLAMDEKFALQERVTTLLTLSDKQLASPAGAALLQDVKAHLSNLKIAAQFPIRLSRRHLVLPAGAFVLALLACVFDPLLSELKFAPRINAEPSRKTNIDAKEIQQRMDELKKLITKRNEELPPKSEQLQELEKELEKLVNQPFDNKSEEKIRERISEMRKFEDKLRDRLEGLREKTEQIDFLKKQLQKLGLDKDANMKDGPAKDFEDALMKGQFDKAKDILEKLAKDLKSEKLSKEQQKEMADQFKKLQEKMSKLMDSDMIKQMKQDAKDGKISQEQLQKALEEFKDVKELSDVLGECSECLGKLKSKEAGEKLDQMMEKFKQIELTEEEIRDLLRDQDDIDEAARLLMATMGGREGDDGEEGEGSGDRPGGRRRADPNDPNSKILDQRQKAQLDPRGAQRVTGYARGGNFNKIPAKEIDGAFKQAAQEAPEAIERQRIPDDAADIARGYFNKLGNQK